MTDQELVVAAQSALSYADKIEASDRPFDIYLSREVPEPLSDIDGNEKRKFHESVYDEPNAYSCDTSEDEPPKKRTKLPSKPPHATNTQNDSPSATNTKLVIKASSSAASLNVFGRYSTCEGDITITDTNPRTGLSKFMTRGEQGRYVQGTVTVNGLAAVHRVNDTACHFCRSARIPCVTIIEDPAKVFGPGRLASFAAVRCCGKCIQMGNGPGNCTNEPKVKSTPSPAKDSVV